MKNHLISFIVLLSTLLSFAQNPTANTLDSIVSWLEAHVKVPEDSLKIGINSRKAIQLSKATENRDALAKSYRFLSFYHKEYSKLDSMLFYLNKAKAIYTKEKNKNDLAETLLELKSYHNLKTEYGTATELSYEALKLFEETNNQKGIARCYAHIGDLLFYENNYNDGISWCNKAIAIQKPLDVKEDLALSYRYKANNQLFSGADLNDALTSINNSIDLYRELGEYGIPMMASLNWRGNIYKYMDLYDEAIADYDANLKMSKQLGLERYLYPSLANIGHVYLMQGNYEAALPYNLEAIEIMKKTGRIRSLWENYMHVSNIYESLGDYKMALDYNKLYAEAYVQLKDNAIVALESGAQAKYETGRKNATIYFQNEKIAQQQRAKVLYIVLAGLLAFILFGLFYYYQKRRKRNEQLLALNSELDSKNKQNELLLKEIHHRVKNNLELVKSLIALQSAQLEDSATKDAMIASQNRVQSMGIIHQKLYQGENLGSIDMKDYFINLGDGILDTFDADEKVKIECAMDQLELDVDTAVPIGLIVNELLTNALKYAFPDGSQGKIEISLSRSNPETLTLKIADNGIGKTGGVSPTGTGFGTQLIQLLTQQLNGKMQEINDNGTAVIFQFKTKHAA